MRLHVHVHLPETFHLKLETVPNPALAAINTNLTDILMKLSEVKTQIAAAAAQSAEAFAELGSKIAALQKQIDDLIAGASDPEVSDEVFLADLNTLKTNVQQLAEIVPNTPPAEPA